MDFERKLPPREEIKRISKALDEDGIHRPLKDGLQNAYPDDLDFEKKPPSREEIARISKALNAKGVDRPIKDGLEDNGLDAILAEDELAHGSTRTKKERERNMNSLNDEEVTSNDEKELPGTLRPKRGAGWWGRGRPMQPHRKGINKDLSLIHI